MITNFAEYSLFMCLFIACFIFFLKIDTYKNSWKEIWTSFACIFIIRIAWAKCIITRQSWWPTKIHHEELLWSIYNFLKSRTDNKQIQKKTKETKNDVLRSFFLIVLYICCSHLVVLLYLFVEGVCLSALVEYIFFSFLLRVLFSFFIGDE